VNKEDVLSVNDWIKISIKFSGPCSICKKKIDKGSYAYWSRSSKSILHDSCYDSIFLSSNIKQLNDNVAEDDSKYVKKDRKIEITNDNSHTFSTIVNRYDNNSIGIANRKERKTKCFICDRNIDFNNDLIQILTSLIDSSNNAKSDIMYCHECLESINKGVDEKYKKRFMSKLI
jgi:hypothetical protein